MDHPIRHIVIVGGGAAGWLTAAVLAAEHHANGLRVTLVESPDVPTIGVGEGTWPSMRDTLRRIGVSETAFFRACDAACKQGSRFNGWVTGAADDYYFHPFSLPLGFGDADLAARWHTHAGVPFADLVSPQPHLCVAGCAPKQAGTPEFAAVANYGYHLDAAKFGVFLREHCTGRLGVRHVSDHVTGVVPAANGDVAGVATRAHGTIEGDLFVDCSGMRALLLGGHFEVPLVPQRHILFNDRALALQVPYPAPDSPIASQTSSTAQRAGWIWDIGLPARRGLGYVYSSAHTSDAEAEAELRAYAHATGAPADLPAARKLAFEPAYRERFWHRNCVAIGMAAGFIEPLEASALALVELSAAMLADELPATRTEVDLVARRFNDAFTYRWERVVEFLKLHYVLSRRTDSAYWHDNRQPETIPPRLAELRALWRHRPPGRTDFHRLDEVFPAASYQYVFYGMGQRSALRPRASDQPEAADNFLREAAALTRRMLAALPAHRELLDHIAQHGLRPA